jgi:NADPH:quinone reductase-like Zn-dependent oxidoreductase
LTTMKAVGFTSFGKPEKLEILDLPEPKILEPDDILVRVEAVGLNPVDMARLSGFTRIAETIK